MEEFQEGSMFHTGAKGGNDDEATKKFECTVKYALTEYLFLVTAEAQYVQHTTSSYHVILI
jgi:hypothetical protein